MTQSGATLNVQIQLQTHHALNFGRAMGRAMSAMRSAARMSRDAANLFEEEASNLQRAGSALLSAFGYNPGEMRDFRDFPGGGN
jgi:hypothetical protein